MLLSRILEKLQNISSPEFAVSPEITRVEIHFTKSDGDFLVKRIILAPELTFATVLEAKQQNANLIITPSSLFQPDMKSLEYHQVDIWRLMIMQRIAHIHLGSEWGNSNNGFSTAIINILDLTSVDFFFIIDPYLKQKNPAGRIASFNRPFQGDFEEFLTQQLPVTQILHAQNENSAITNIAVIPLQNIPSSVIYQAIDCNCDVIIGGDFSPNAFQAAQATGLNLYVIPPLALAQVGLKYLARLLAVEYPNEEFSFFDSLIP